MGRIKTPVCAASPLDRVPGRGGSGGAQCSGGVNYTVAGDKLREPVIGAKSLTEIQDLGWHLGHGTVVHQPTESSVIDESTPSIGHIWAAQRE